MVFGRFRWRYLLLPPCLVACLVGERMWTTVRLEERFDARYAALRASGALTAWEDLAFESPPADQNAWDALVAAGEMLENIDAEWRGEDHEHHWDVPLWDPEIYPWSPEAAAEAELYEAKLPPYFAKVDAALELPVIVPTMTDPLDYPDVTKLMSPSRMSLERTERYPEAAAKHLQRLLRLLQSYQPRRIIEALLQATYWREGLARVRDGVDDLDVDMLSDWVDMLRAEEARVVRFVRPTQLADRATNAWILRSLRRGVDPLVAIRRKTDDLLRHLPTIPETDPIGRVLRVPRYDLRWHRRPGLLEHCLHGLDRLEARVVRTWTLESLRGVAGDPAYEGTYFVHYAAKVLETVAAMRRARIALAAHLEGPDDDAVEERRARVAKRLGGSLPEDPRTDEPFPWKKAGGEHVIGDGDAAWRVR